MQVSNSYKIIADKLLHKKTFKEVITLDTFYKLLQYMYTEEEAEIVSHLTFAMKTPKAIAKMANLPVEKVQPILDSLAERVLIIGISRQKSPRYGLLNFYPGLYEAQMVISEMNMKEGDDGSSNGGCFSLGCGGNHPLEQSPQALLDQHEKDHEAPHHRGPEESDPEVPEDRYPLRRREDLGR